MIKYNKELEKEARWLCLFEAVNYISAKAELKGIDNQDILKHVPIFTYIKERFPATLKDLEYETNLERVNERCNSTST